MKNYIIAILIIVLAILWLSAKVSHNLDLQHEHDMDVIEQMEGRTGE